MSKEKNRNTLRYYGWSTVLVESERAGDLVFDPFYSSDYSTYWADLRDFEKVSVICLSHGHHEHYTDAHKVASRSGASIVAPPRLCEHLASYFQVPKQRLVPVNPGETVDVNGYSITAFPWYHRKINYFKFFAGRFFTGCRFVLNNLLHTPLDTPFAGFVVKTPDGLTLLNMTEGMNDKMPSGEVAALAKIHQPDLLVGGWQLQYESDVARCVKESGAPRCLLYHPHGKLFDLMRIPSTPIEIVRAKIHEAVPGMEIFTPEPREGIAL